MKISVIGLGRLGLPFVYFLASHRYKVLCYDINKSIYNVLEKTYSKEIEDWINPIVRL
mgnify:CR=1 FL=1